MTLTGKIEICWALSMFHKCVTLVIVAVMGFVSPSFTSNVRAETATFISSSLADSETLSTLSTQGDSEGFLVGEGQSLRLLFDTPFATSRRDRVSIFTLADTLPGGIARGAIRIGVYNAGDIQIVRSFNFVSGRRRNLNNLFRRGCGELGGCNFIEIVTRRTTGSAEGVHVDYVTINGEVVSVIAPAPEPQIWAMMILGFVIVGWRLKQIRRVQLDPDIACRQPASLASLFRRLTFVHGVVNRRRIS